MQITSTCDGSKNGMIKTTNLIYKKKQLSQWSYEWIEMNYYPDWTAEEH